MPPKPLRIQVFEEIIATVEAYQRKFLQTRPVGNLRVDTSTPNNAASVLIRKTIQSTIFGRELLDVDEKLLEEAFKQIYQARTSVDIEIATNNLKLLQNNTLAARPLTPSENDLLRVVLANDLLAKRHHSAKMVDSHFQGQSMKRRLRIYQS
jgi:hypothetical protein